MNLSCAKVLPLAKRLYGAMRRPAVRGGRQKKMSLLLIQLKDGHEGFGGQLHSTQGTHFLLACSLSNKFAGGPKWFQMLGQNEFVLRQDFAFGKTLVRRDAPPRRAGWKAEENVLTPHPA
jgi:hypothetical protein